MCDPFQYNNVHITILHNLTYHGRGWHCCRVDGANGTAALGKKKKRETEIREYSDTVVAHDKGTQQLV